MRNMNIYIYYMNMGNIHYQNIYKIPGLIIHLQKNKDYKLLGNYLVYMRCKGIS